MSNYFNITSSWQTLDEVSLSLPGAVNTIGSGKNPYEEIIRDKNKEIAALYKKFAAMQIEMDELKEQNEYLTFLVKEDKND